MKARRGAVAIIATLLIVPLSISWMLAAAVAVGSTSCQARFVPGCFASPNRGTTLDRLIGDDPIAFAGGAVLQVTALWLAVFLAWRASLASPPAGRRSCYGAVALLAVLLLLELV